MQTTTRQTLYLLLFLLRALPRPFKIYHYPFHQFPLPIIYFGIISPPLVGLAFSVVMSLSNGPGFNMLIWFILLSALVLMVINGCSNWWLLCRLIGTYFGDFVMRVSMALLKTHSPLNMPEDLN